MIVEHRKHVRFVPQQNTFAALGKNYSRVGKVKDISLDGLSIEYLFGESIKKNSSKVDIFLVGNIFHLYNLPCRMVYDIEIHVPHVNNNFIKPLTTKRCGIEFNEISKDDLAQLKLFLQAHTIGISK
jgi:hypothetical protein